MSFNGKVGILAILTMTMARAAVALEVEVIVDEGVCQGANVQCSDFAAPFGATGHTPDPADATNHNPVAIIVHVSVLNRPLQNLPASAFRLEQKFQPANAPGYTVCNDIVASDSGVPDGVGCGGGAEALFQNAGGGVYAFYVHPSVAGYNWKSGKYTFVVVVGDPQRGIGRGFGAFEIP
jgi:hypothetical protein